MDGPAASEQRQAPATPPGPPPVSDPVAVPAQPPGPPAVPVSSPVLATVRAPSGAPASFRRAVSKYLSKKAPANRYSNLSPQTCRRRLKGLKLPLRWESSTSGIANPVRLTGAVNGVTFAAPPRSVPFGLLDCRLVLTLRDFAALLRRHGVIKVKVDNYYRPGARLGSGRRSQHSYGLAIDILEFVLKDGSVLDVEDDYRGKRGQVSCGPQTRVVGNHPRGVRLRNILCDTARAGLFHHMLTPNYDAAHRNHFHFDIKRGTKTLWVK